MWGVSGFPWGWIRVKIWGSLVWCTCIILLRSHLCEPAQLFRYFIAHRIWRIFEWEWKYILHRSFQILCENRFLWCINQKVSHFLTNASLLVPSLHNLVIHVSSKNLGKSFKCLKNQMGLGQAPNFWPIWFHDIVRLKPNLSYVLLDTRVFNLGLLVLGLNWTLALLIIRLPWLDFWVTRLY